MAARAACVGLDPVDAKRGDIASTNLAYRDALFGYPILVAGIGPPGGPVGEVVRAGPHQGRGLIISSSRAVTDAVPGPGFARAARAAAQALIDQIYDAVTTLGPR